MINDTEGFTGLAMDVQNRTPNAGDERLLVKFYTEAIQDKAASLEEGRPIFRDRELLSIMVPGNRDGVVKLATDADKQRFPAHYQAFKLRQDQVVLEGMPLEEWPGITRSQMEEARFKNIRTVEALSNAPDSALLDMRGFMQLKEKAVKYLEVSKDNATAGKLVEAEKRASKLEAQLEQLQAQMNTLINKDLDGEVPDFCGDIPAAPVRRKRRTKAEMEAARK